MQRLACPLNPCLSSRRLTLKAYFGYDQTMKYGPDVSIVASLIGDPARSNMIMALMSGLSLSAAELAREAGVTPSTATGHLSKLEASGLLISTKKGRHRHFRVANQDVAHLIEALIAVSTRAGHMRSRPGPKDEAMRHARSCYDHLAGRLAVAMFERWVSAHILRWHDDVVELTDKGRRFIIRRGIDIEAIERKKRPICRTCIDWSERQHHLGGAIGSAVLAHVLDRQWATRKAQFRTISFSASGEKMFVDWSSP
jgi:DNA-binding transcriptional ArsR family regulator